jgi:hypothetical protein
MRPFPAFLSIAYVMTGYAKVVKVLLGKYSRTFSDELGIKLESNPPTSLFRWPCAALLFSPRKSSKIAVEVGKAGYEKGVSAIACGARTMRIREGPRYNQGRMNSR